MMFMLEIDGDGLVAWFGAITGGTALLWDVFKWLLGGAQLTVVVNPGMVMVGAGVDRRESEKEWVLVKVCNTGDRATTLTHLGFAAFARHGGLRPGWKRTRSVLVLKPGFGELPYAWG